MSQITNRFRSRVWTRDAVAFNVVGYVLITLFMLMCILPFILIVVSSFAPEQTLICEGYSIFPPGFR